MRHGRLRLVLFAAWLGIAVAAVASAAPVRVRFPEGSAHGFVLLREGERTIAAGDWWQIPDGDRLEINLRFQFRDGSLAHETYTVTQQRRTFTMLSYKVIQRGPSFPTQLEAELNCENGRYTVRHRNATAKSDTVDSGELTIPDDLYGAALGAVLIRNVEPGGALDIHTVVFTPKPRVLGLKVTETGEDSFVLGHQSRAARRYVGHLEIGGVLGVAASLVGKAPPDLHWWMAGDPVPAFVRFEGPLYANGPLWRVDFVGPQWRK